MPQPTTIAQARRGVHARSGRWDRFVSAFSAVPAPARWRAFKRSTLADLHAVTASNRRLAASLSGHPSLASVLHAVSAEEHATTPVSKRFNRRMDRAGLIFCGSRN
jgi:hypothetical protein